VLGATYDVHLGLIGKRIVDWLPISVNWTFLLGATAEALRANIDWKTAISLQRGPVNPKFLVEGVAPNHSPSHKTRLSVLSYGMKVWTDLSSVLSHCTRLPEELTDRQTDRRTDTFLVTRPPCIQCRAVKSVTTYSLCLKILFSSPSAAVTQVSVCTAVV